MRKKFIFVTLLVSLLAFQSFFVPEAMANDPNSLGEVQQKRNNVQKDLSAQEEKINEFYEQLQGLREEVQRLDAQLAEKEEKVEEITYQIDSTMEEISTLQEEIEQLNISIEQRFELLKTRAASYQKTGGLISYIEVLFGAQSFGDFISRLTAVNQIMDSDAQLMEQLEAEMKLVEEHQLTTLEKLDELNDMKAEQEAELVSIEEEKNEREKAQASLQRKQDELVAYVEKLKSEDRELAAMEDKIKKEIAAAEKREQEKASVKKTSQPVKVAKVEHKISNSKSESSEKSSNTASDNKKSITVTSTAYTANCNGCSGITSTGINLKANPNARVIAVDPSVIPLNTVVHVEGYGYAVTGDTGSSIKGNKIDVFFSSLQSARNWGKRTVKVTIP